MVAYCRDILATGVCYTQGCTLRHDVHYCSGCAVCVTHSAVEEHYASAKHKKRSGKPRSGDSADASTASDLSEWPLDEHAIYADGFSPSDPPPVSRRILNRRRKKEKAQSRKAALNAPSSANAVAFRNSAEPGGHTQLESASEHESSENSDDSSEYFRVGPSANPGLLWCDLCEEEFPEKMHGYHLTRYGPHKRRLQTAKLEARVSAKAEELGAVTISEPEGIDFGLLEFSVQNRKAPQAHALIIETPNKDVAVNLKKMKVSSDLGGEAEDTWFVLPFTLRSLMLTLHLTAFPPA